MENINESDSYSLKVMLALTLVVACVFYYSFRPVSDGDLWWQMAYGRYILQHATLVVDHSIFSWTEAANDYIYCAWIGELTLYLVYKTSGLFGLGVLRAVVMLVPLFLLIWMNRKTNKSLSIILILGVLLCYLVSRNAAGLLKPELFSYAFFSVLVALYFLIKRTGDDSYKIIYAIPLIILLWVNTHAAFAIGCFFLLIAYIGEAINYFTKSSVRLSTRQFKHLTYACALSVLAIVITPYGYEYPLQLIGEFIDGERQQNYSNVSAYNGIYDDSLSHLNMPLYLGLATLILLPFVVEKLSQRRMDFGLLLVVGSFLVMSTGYGRLSYFCPVVLLFALNLLMQDSYWLSKIQANTRSYVVISIVCLTLITGLIGHRVLVDSIGDSRGERLGVGYLNPASEAEFLETYFPGEKFCNGYNGGGYLLWKFWPKQKVMIDPRYFPYHAWYDRWFKMTTSSKPQPYIEKFDCNIWILNHVYEYVNTALVRMPDWKPIFIGEAGIVFVRADLYARIGGLQLADGLSEISSLPRSAHVLNHFLLTREYQLALELAESNKEKWSGTGNANKAEKALAFVRGTIAYEAQEDYLAYGLLRKGNSGETVISNRSRQVKAGQFLTEKLWKMGDFASAHRIALEVLAFEPENFISLYNAAALSLQGASSREPAVIPSGVFMPSGVPGQESKWLKRFLELATEESTVPEKYITYAEQMLSTGRADFHPPLRPTARSPLSEADRSLLDTFLHKPEMP